MALENIVKATKIVKGRFPTDSHFYRYISKELDGKRKVTADAIRRNFLDGKLPEDIARVVRQSSQTIQSGRGLYDDNFLPVDRREVSRLLGEIENMVQPFLDWYQFKTNEALTCYISDETDVSHSVVQSYLLGEGRVELTPGILRVHSFMQRMVDAAKYAFEQRHKMPPVPKRYVLGEKSILEATDQTVARIFGEQEQTVQRGAKTFIDSKMRKLTRVGQVSDLARKVQKGYGITVEKALTLYVCNMAEMEYREQIWSRVRSGLREPYPQHRKAYVVLAAMEYAAKIGIKGKVLEGMDKDYLPLGRKEYVKVIDDFRDKTKAGRYVTSLIIAQALKTKPEIVRAGYLTRRNGTMAYEDAAKIKQLGENPPFFVFNMGKQGTNTAELGRFAKDYKGGDVLVDYVSPKNQFDRPAFGEVMHACLAQSGRVFFRSPKVQLASLLPVRGYRTLFPKMFS